MPIVLQLSRLLANGSTQKFIAQRYYTTRRKVAFISASNHRYYSFSSGCRPDGEIASSSSSRTRARIFFSLSGAVALAIITAVLLNLSWGIAELDDFAAHKRCMLALWGLNFDRCQILVGAVISLFNGFSNGLSLALGCVGCAVFGLKFFDVPVFAAIFAADLGLFGLFYLRTHRLPQFKRRKI